MNSVKKYIDRIEREIAGIDVGEPLQEPALHALRGGKRLRPALLLLAADSCGGRWQELGRAAVAVECIHAYSLVHDDLPAMDDDDLRRGQPTVHRAFGEATAILVGDGLLTLAFALLSAPLEGVPSDRQLAAVHEVAVGAGFGPGMVGGQALDLQGVEGEEGALRVSAAKTGYPLGAAAAAGALLAGAPQATVRDLREYGQELGIAFQIKDDLLDVLGSEVELGKRLRKDARKERPNIVRAIGVDGAQAALREHSGAALAALAKAQDRGVRIEGLRLLVEELMKRTH